ncbi:glycoside hydrolase family 88 protein [Parabacteroides sp. Marseille-P3160]|uniref:glycoside hydrolase family 88 protein n=1 Tax=Parabacteroides sp. Marseille-P3160 TaxID=1917887 RepID=UPI0009BA3390|nr:glycoside hydrolase family 88 protein [Parabacteroides sp. Marseille-P3160]
MKTKHLIFLPLLSILLLVSCRKTEKQDLLGIIDKSLERATVLSLDMAKSLENDTLLLPRSFENGKLVTSDSRWWCSGFFPGVLWYLYENQPTEELKKYAVDYTDRVEREKFTTDNHDVGFMVYCSFGNGFRLLETESYKEVILQASKSLSTRYKDPIGLIRSWDWNKETWQYPVIIDNMMNLEMLMWAAKNSGDKRFEEIARNHADKTMKEHFRPDYSCFHLVDYDTITGNARLKQTVQGYSDSSSWARGQAWAIYGYTMMYRETGDKKYLDHAEHIARFILNHPRLPEDKIPYWDFDAPNIPDELRDASAGAVMASAFIELSTLTSDKKLSEQCLRTAETQIRTLSSPEYLAEPGTNGNFILKHSVGSLPGKQEVDVPLTYADYYYVEAMVRYKKLGSILKAG